MAQHAPFVCVMLPHIPFGHIGSPFSALDLAGLCAISLNSRRAHHAGGEFPLT